MTGRLYIAGGCYHLMGRGLEKAETACLAWAMMSNHYRLLIRAGKQPLSDLVRNLLGGYAGSYNRRHKRAG
jgi:hypothetical protein